MKIGTIKVDHDFKVVFSGIHSLILQFETQLGCRNAMWEIAWFCDKDENFFVTSINGKILEIVYTRTIIHYHNGNVWVD